ncbi:sensor histidine kinase [Terriglobus aquaticus]|uniref:histidine kinase n=1 Tax=Terriglobus aquaticus TaxID=940139 RepID=A0ABW9KL43_9BACT|nr:HAMP domain-containing sensor histidine kinase [Terriglobus aquaticus]
MYAVALLVFVLVELGFSYFHFATPRTMFLVAAIAVSLRLAELALSRKEWTRSRSGTRMLVCASITLGVVAPFLLAAATRQFHTHYFGLLILPVLEAALYFSLTITLMAATVASLTGLLWVSYAAHFRPPFQLGELLETATLALLLYTVGTLVWLLLDLLRRRDVELRARMEDLETTRARLVEEEKLAAVGRLASAVAHEIRNPVAIISSAMEAAGSVALSEEDRDEMSRIALAEAQRLEKLTTEFLSYAQPDRFACREVEAEPLIGYVCSIAKAQALRKELSIRPVVTHAPLLFGNQDRLQQALLNLVRNAIDATPAGGEIVVRCASEAEMVCIAVENEGECIPAYAVPQIFEPFFTAKSGGTGLGLSIARRIAEAHEGTLTLARNEQGRVCFQLKLPAFAGQLKSSAVEG